MNLHSIRIVPKRDEPPAVAPGKLANLSDLDHDDMLADPLPNFRDWKVTLPDGRRVGTVGDISRLAYFDTTAGGGPRG